MQTAIPRFRWLWRSLVGLALLIVGLVALRLAWGLYAEWRLSAKIAEYRAAGEPVYPEDFARPSLADEDNAAVFIRAAAGQTSNPDFPNGLSMIDATSDPDLLIDYPDAAEHMVAANGAALVSLASVRMASGCDFGPIDRIGYSPTQFNEDQAIRRLVQIAAVVSLHAHLSRNDAYAIETMRDAITISNLIHKRGGIMGYLTAMSPMHGVTALLEFILPELLDDSGTRYMNANNASRRSLIALTSELWNDQREEDSWRYAWQTECARDLMYLRYSVAGTLENLSPTTVPSWRGPVFAALFAPQWQLSALRRLKIAEQLSWDVNVSDWQRLRRTEDPKPISVGVREIDAWLRSYHADSQKRFVQLHLGDLLRRRFAATAIAIRLYQLDHGRRPATLAELVPTYLHNVPRDLFAPGDVPIGYIGTGRQPRLYSVGTDGIDHGGIEPRPGDGYRGNNADILFQLDRRNFKLPNWGAPHARPSRRATEQAAAEASERAAESSTTQPSRPEK